MARGSSAKTHKTKMKVQFQATGERRVVASFRSVDQAARGSTQGLEGFRGSLLSIDAALGIATQTMAALGTAFNTLKVPVGLAVDFEKQFAQIRTLSSSIGSELEAQLLDLAASVPQTAGDIAESAYSAISAGIDPTRTVEFLEAASKAAVAGNSTLTESTQALTKTLAGFKEEGLGAERAMDVLFATVKRGDTNFTELASSVGMVAGAAGTAGVSVEEMGAAIATISKSAPSTSIAVTNLNAVIKTLTKPTNQTQAAFEELGVGVGALAIKNNGLIPTLRALSKAIGDDVVKLNSLTQSTEAQAGFNALLSGSMKGLEDDFKAVTESEGALNAANEILAATTQNAIDQFNAAAEGALRDIGRELLPDVLAGFQAVSDWWSSKGPSVIQGLKDLYQAGKLALDIWLKWQDALRTVTGLKLAEAAVYELSEAIGITSDRADAAAKSMWDLREASAAAARASSSEMKKRIDDARALVDAAVATGDAKAAEVERFAAAILIQNKIQDAVDLQQRQRQEALATQSQLAQAQSEEMGQERIDTLKNELLFIGLRQNATKRDIALAREQFTALQLLNVEKLAAAAARKKADEEKSPARRGGGGALKSAADQARALARIREQGLQWEAQLIEDALTRELQLLSLKHSKEREKLIAAGEGAAELRSVLDSKQVQDRAKLLERFAEAERTKRDSQEAARFDFEQSLVERSLQLVEDESERRLALLAIAQERELAQARRAGQDLSALRTVQAEETARAERDAAADARAAQAADMEQWASGIREGGQLTIDVMESIAKGAEIIGIQGDLAQKALAVTRGLVSAADAISYGAQSAAAFASYNVFSGIKYGAAALGAGLASAAYFKAAGGGGGGSTPAVSASSGGGGAVLAQAAPASAADLGAPSSGSSGPTQITYVLNQHAPVFDTQTEIDRFMAEGVRRQQRAPGGVSVVSPRDVRSMSRG